MRIFKDYRANSVDPDEVAKIIWIYTVYISSYFGFWHLKCLCFIRFNIELLLCQ